MTVEFGAALEFSLADIHAQEIRLSSYRKQKNVVLFFYADTCPCWIKSICLKHKRQKGGNALKNRLVNRSDP